MYGLSWRVISAVDFKVDDLVVYIPVDTIAPKDKPEFSFLENKKFRINIIKLRGEYSNGLIMPLGELMKYLPASYYDVDPNDLIDTDVGEYLGVEKYEKPVSYESGDVAGSFPTHLVPKTDEERLENMPDIIEMMKGRDVVATVKHDGSSVTIVNHAEDGFKVCSRNLEIKESGNSKYWQPVFKYNLKEKLPVGIGLQLELVGEGIQKNPEKLKGVDARVFNVWKLDRRILCDWNESVQICTTLGIPMVDLYYEGPFKWETADDLVEEAKKVKYANGATAEGLVWRLRNHLYSERLNKDLSFKTINYQYTES
jgi:RNA ligase (TIGR02306 family)